MPTTPDRPIRPMLATHGSTPGAPTGDAWVHEVKWDGIRLLADVVDGQVRLTNRNGIDVTVTYPELHTPQGLPADVLLDGEVIAVNPDGSATLASLAPRMHQREPRKVAQLAAGRPAQYMVFDLLRLDGSWLLDQPLTQRRAKLEALDVGRAGAGWQVPPQYDDADVLTQATLEAGMEGLVSKRRTSRYQPGTRSADWLKVPHRTEFVGVIGGWVSEQTSPNRIGALWIGHPHDEATFDQDGLLYPITRAGSGLSHAQRDDLHHVLSSIEVGRCPFVPAPVGPDARRAHWVEPILCVQVRYLGQPGGFSPTAALAASEAGQLRQPVLRRLRPDVTALEAPYVVMDEEPTAP